VVLVAARAVRQLLAQLSPLGVVANICLTKVRLLKDRQTSVSALRSRFNERILFLYREEEVDFFYFKNKNKYEKEINIVSSEKETTSILNAAQIFKKLRSYVFVPA